ncbi:MAG: class II aldolase/adducin family protein [SAR324 cluster bacterium]|nr:class II aldolase/adducin family protein [SAR324 cluster bacterium]
MMKKERKVVADFMCRLYERGLTTISGGNISILCDDHVLMTPSGLDKGRLKAKQIVIMTLDGENLTPDLTPTIEKDMHLAIYKSNPEVKAIVHAHPLTATAFTSTDKTISTDMLGELYALLREPGRVGYATMGTMSLAEQVGEASKKYRVMLMDNHGVLATGNTILEAFDRIELLEIAAKTTLINEFLNQKNCISEEDLKKIAELKP